MNDALINHLNSKRTYYSDYGFELTMTLGQAKQITHSGECDEDVLLLSQVDEVAAQLRTLDSIKVRRELKEWGAWDSKELKDHVQNLQRLLWVAAGQIVDEECGRAC